MTMNEIYKDLKELQNIAWKNDDLMTQDTLFEMQEMLADLTLKVAVAAHQENDLVKEFPWLYTTDD